MLSEPEIRLQIIYFIIFKKLEYQLVIGLKV